MNFSAELTFASFSSPSLLTTIAHTSDKKPSIPTSSNGCGGKNDVVPQPVRVWKRRAVDGIHIKILSLLRGPSYHPQDGARDTRWMCRSNSRISVYVANTAAVRHLMWWQCNMRSVSAFRGCFITWWAHFHFIFKPPAAISILSVAFFVIYSKETLLSLLCRLALVGSFFSFSGEGHRLLQCLFL